MANSTRLSTILNIALPKLVPCQGDTADQVIISAAGFEDRAFALLKMLVIRHPTRVVLIRYKNWADNNRVADVVDAYRNAGIAVEQGDQLEYDALNPDLFADELMLWLSARAPNAVTVDVSAMSRLAIMLTLDVCREIGVAVNLFYAEATDYAPSQGEYEEARRAGLPRPSIQVYSGVGGVVRATRLSSVALQGEPTAAIAFMSMNELLTQALVNSIYPTKLFLINGRPPRHPWREEATAWIHEQLRREWPDKDNPTFRTTSGIEMPIRSTSTLDYIESAAEILNIYWSVATEFRIILAPTGSKMQAVGAFIARATHSDIHVEYPTPKGFLPNYSSGVTGAWLVRFGRLGDLVLRVRTEIVENRISAMQQGDSDEAATAETPTVSN
jgi:hypothetical protein